MLSYVLDQNVLEEGYYNLSAKVSMISDFGNIIADSVGKGVIAQKDIYGAAVQVQQSPRLQAKHVTESLYNLNSC